MFEHGARENDVEAFRELREVCDVEETNVVPKSFIYEVVDHTEFDLAAMAATSESVPERPGETSVSAAVVEYAEALIGVCDRNLPCDVSTAMLHGLTVRE